ncbi:uncharacterized protein VSU04_011739 isoform 1-T1 [Chlamydotis macqueenii]
MSTAKPRRMKFSEEEKFLILEEFRLRKDILIPENGRYKNTLARRRAWEEIAAAVNSLSPLVRRSPEEIRRKWHNMVDDARRELAVGKNPLHRQRPQQKLFHSIFALFNKPIPRVLDPMISAPDPRARASSSSPRTQEAASDLLPQGQSSDATPGHRLLCPVGSPAAPGPVPERLFSAASEEPDSRESLLRVEPQDRMERRPTTPGTAPAAPGLPAAEVLPPVAARPAALQGHDAAETAPVPPTGSPKPPAPSRVKRPLSPELAWPCLTVTESLAKQSRGTGSPSPLAPEENGEVPTLLPDSAHLPGVHRVSCAGPWPRVPAPCPGWVGCGAAVALLGQRLLLCHGPAVQIPHFSRRRASSLSLPIPAPTPGQPYPAPL